MRLTDLLREAGLADRSSLHLPSAGGRTVDSGGIVEGTLEGIDVTGIAYSSQNTSPGDVFFALPGHRAHGADFAAQAVAAGAVAVVTDAAGVREAGDLAVPVVQVIEARTSMALMAKAFFSDPSTALDLLGVTGTNGKTSVTYLLQAAMQAGGVPCGVVGTIGARLPDGSMLEQRRTTPEAPDLQRTFALMRDHGAKAVAMEVSSIAVRERRVDGVTFDVMGFTGLSQDHLDYHGTMEEYFQAKAEMFDSGRADVGVVMLDSPWGERLVERATIPVVTVTTRSDVAADWRVRRVGSTIRIDGPESIHGPMSADMSLPLATDFAVANAVLTVAIAAARGVPAQVSADAIATARVPGRMELVASVAGTDFVVDYAHSPDSIEKVVDSAVAARADGSGRVIVVLGAGGDRDQSKRPAMGRAASKADVIVITDDNPRSEDPASIRAMVRAGIDAVKPNVSEIAPRDEAIGWAVEAARPGDVVLVLGKGHETVQELADGVTPFDDRDVLASFVRHRFGQHELKQHGFGQHGGGQGDGA